MKTIPLTQGKFAIVDDEDYQYLCRWNWCVAQSTSNKYYPVRRVEKLDGASILISMDYFILPPKPHGTRLVHKNRDTLDLRRENIEYRQNSTAVHNKSKTKRQTSSRYKGVCFCRSRDERGLDPWVAKLGYNYKCLHIGYFSTEKEAAIAYNKKAKELYGDFAYQNIID